MKNSNNKAFIAISFAQGFMSPNIPIATFSQGDVELNFIIDTGSDQNVIDSSILNKIEHHKTENKTTLTGVGGSVVAESCNITFGYGEDSYTTEFLISDLRAAFDTIKKAHAIPLHGMLGSKFLKENNLVLDFTNMVAYNKEG